MKASEHSYPHMLIPVKQLLWNPHARCFAGARGREKAHRAKSQTTNAMSMEHAPIRMGTHVARVAASKQVELGRCLANSVLGNRPALSRCSDHASPNRSRASIWAARWPRAQSPVKLLNASDRRQLSTTTSSPERPTISASHLTHHPVKPNTIR